jgi:hypothetical protein
MRSNQKNYKLTMVHYNMDKELQSSRTVVVIGLSEGGKII